MTFPPGAVINQPISRKKSGSRFTMEYKPASLAFWNTDAEEMAQGISEITMYHIKNNFRRGMDANGANRTRKGDSIEKRKKIHKRITRKQTKPKISEIKEKFPDAPKHSIKGLQAMEYANVKQSRDKDRKIKKHFRYKGKIYDPRQKTQKGVIFSGLMFDSLHTTKPKTARKRKIPGTRKRVWTSGEIRISVTSKRKMAGIMNKFFEFGPHSRLHHQINGFTSSMMQKAVTRRDYYRRKKLYKNLGKFLITIIRRSYGI